MEDPHGDIYGLNPGSSQYHKLHRHASSHKPIYWLDRVNWLDREMLKHFHVRDIYLLTAEQFYGITERPDKWKEDKLSVNAQVTAEIEKRSVEKEVKRRLEIISKWPDFDDYDEGTVIKFDKQFTKNGKKYAYVALKVDDKWYLTGGKVLSSAELVRFLAAEGEVIAEAFYLASSWSHFDQMRPRNGITLEDHVSARPK